MNTLMVTTLSVGTLWAATRSIFGNNLGVFTTNWVVPIVLSLNLLFLPKTSVHIIDKVDAHFHYVKVDNIPVGLAAIPSIVSQVSRYLTQKIEQDFTAVDGLRYGETGMLFAARLVQKGLEAQLADPLDRENVKGFMRRCFLWPYVYSNVKGLKSEAKKSKDILGFIDTHAHSMLGTYWKEDNGQATFVPCKACVPKVRAARH